VGLVSADRFVFAGNLEGFGTQLSPAPWLNRSICSPMIYLRPLDQRLFRDNDGLFIKQTELKFKFKANYIKGNRTSPPHTPFSYN
jgi:hypothetical protein